MQLLLATTHLHSSTFINLMPHHETSSSDMTEEMTKVEADRVLSF